MKHEDDHKIIYRNDYKLRADLLRYADAIPFVRKYIKPRLKSMYHAINAFLPYPRDFILKKVPKHSVCCEVGVWRGEFSRRIYTFVEPKKLYLVDPWFFFTEADYFPAEKLEKYSQRAQDIRHADVMEKFTKEMKDGSVEVIRKSSMEALKLFEDNFFDFVYIDANHDYEFVKEDLEHYYTKTKSGGLISGDDFRLDGVRRAVTEFVDRLGIASHLEIKNDQFLIRKP